MVEGKQQNGVVGRLKLLLNGRSTISRQGSLSSAASPKSIAPRLGVSILSSPTIDIPGISPYRSPTSRLPSPHSARELPSSTVNTLAEPPHTRPRQPAASASPPSPPLARTGRSSPRDGGWEHVRLNSDTAHGRGRRRKKARPRAAARSIFREKSGRFKLIRCVALGTLLAVGLTVCKLQSSLGET